MATTLARSELLTCLQRIITHTSHNPSQLIRQGFYNGPSSISLLFLRLSIFYPDLTIEHQPLLYWARHYFCPFSDDIQLPSTTRCGITNELLSLMVLSMILNPTSASSNVQSLCAKALQLVDEDNPSSDWFNGLAGMLYFLRVAHRERKLHWSTVGQNQEFNPRAALEATGDVAEIFNATHAIIQRVLAMPKPWRYNGKPYLGAAYGAMGIFTQITLSAAAILAYEDFVFVKSYVEAILRDYLYLQFLSGNCPSEIPMDFWPRIIPWWQRRQRPKSETRKPPKPISERSHLGEDRRVQFCHGIPGIIISLRSIQVWFPGTRPIINRFIRIGENCIRNRGVLAKESCLCHSVAGNALALGNYNERLGMLQRHGVRNAINHHLQNPKAEASDHPWGLFGGEAGRAWAWALVDQGLRGRVLAYNDL
ncbi:MAG: hypothetical protein Q9160_003637 [Pyrenula sp. 1 TL-2023]